jgi:hypothetical protein
MSRRPKRKRLQAASDDSHTRGRILVAVCCVALSIFLWWIVHQLQTDPSAEARFAALNDGPGRSVGVADIPLLRTVAVVLLGVAALLLFARGGRKPVANQPR